MQGIRRNAGRVAMVTALSVVNHPEPEVGTVSR